MPRRAARRARGFTEHGFARTCVSSAVRAAGVTKGAPYHRFADQRALLEAVFEEVEQDVVVQLGAAVAEVDNALAAPTTPASRLHAGRRMPSEPFVRRSRPSRAAAR